MKAQIPVDLLQVEERIIGPFDLRQSIALGTAGGVTALSVLVHFPQLICLPAAAACIAYALAELEGVSLRRRLPTLLRYTGRLLRPPSSLANPDPYIYNVTHREDSPPMSR